MVFIHLKAVRFHDVQNAHRGKPTTAVQALHAQRRDHLSQRQQRWAAPLPLEKPARARILLKPGKPGECLLRLPSKSKAIMSTPPPTTLLDLPLLTD